MEVSLERWNNEFARERFCLPQSFRRFRMVVSTIFCDNIGSEFNVTIYLSQYGQLWLLELNCYRSMKKNVCREVNP